MKKLLLSFLIILSVTLCACAPDNGLDDPSYKGDFFKPYDKDTFLNYMSTLTLENGSETVVDFTLSGGTKNNFGYTVSYDDEISVTVNDGNTLSYIADDVFTARNIYENKVKDGFFDGNLLNVVALSPSELFLINDETVKELSMTVNGDGTVTYVPYIYEGQVKTALKALENQFKMTEDVLSLRFTTDYIGYKTEIVVNLSAKFKGIPDPVLISVKVVHTKTIKDIT